MRVSDYIASHLESVGVEAVFLLSGGGMMHLLDSVSRLEKTKYYCNHHEQCSGIAADAYARIKHQIGSCYATSGPGGTNTVTAVAGAYQDSSPVLFVSGQSKVSQTIENSKIVGLRQFGTFEVDIIPIVQPITKYAVMVKSTKDIRYHLEKALFLAMHGRPGPVFLDIPLDIQGAPIDPTQLKGFNPVEEGYRVKNDAPSENSLEQVWQALVKAKRPLILAGLGVQMSKATEEFLNLVKLMQVPVVTTCLGKDIIGFDNSLFVGHPGVKGDRPGNFAVQAADLIISIGASLHVTTTGYELDQFAPNAYKIMIDPDEATLKREQLGVNLKIKSDVGLFVEALLEMIQKKSLSLESRSVWVKKCQFWKENFSVYREKHKREQGKINLYDLSETLDQKADESDIVVTDAGSTFYVVGQAFRVKKGQRVINSGSLGAMGFALPAATGAAVAAPHQRVICLTGDGSLQTNIHELAVFAQYNLNVKLFVVNNDGYVCIRNTQNSFFKGHLAGTSRSSGVLIPDTQKLASAYGITYIGVSEIEDLDMAVSKALSTSGPVICEVFTPPYQEILPTVTSVRLETGEMKSKPLQEMYPFLSEDELKEALQIND